MGTVPDQDDLHWYLAGLQRRWPRLSQLQRGLLVHALEDAKVVAGVQVMAPAEMLTRACALVSSMSALRKPLARQSCLGDRFRRTHVALPSALEHSVMSLQFLHLLGNHGCFDSAHDRPCLSLLSSTEVYCRHADYSIGHAVKPQGLHM